MARYYFQSGYGGGSPDREGVEFPDGRRMKLEAAQLLGELLADHPADFWTARAAQLTVTDDRGRVLLVLGLSILEEAPPIQ